MALKTIFELPAFEGDLDGTEVLPIDTGLQTFKVDLAQVLGFISVRVEDDAEWGAETTEVTYTDIPNARDRIWMFCRAATETPTDEEQIPTAHISFPSDTSVKVSFDIPPGAGTYILKGK